MQNPNNMENLSASNDALKQNLENTNPNTGDGFPPNFREKNSFQNPSLFEGIHAVTAGDIHRANGEEVTPQNDGKITIEDLLGSTEFITDTDSDTSDTSEGSEEIKVDTEVLNDLPGFEGEEILVTGAPLETARILDSNQGDNSYEAYGDCGLTSCANFLTMCGIESTEEEIVGYAVSNDLCQYSLYDAPESRGGSNDIQICTILEDHGVSVDVFYPGETGGNIEDIAEALENGQAVTVGINAGVLWDSMDYYQDGSANHQITLTGTLRNSETNELEGFVACDSGCGEGAKIISVETMNECYTAAAGASAIISEQALRV